MNYSSVLLRISFAIMGIFCGFKLFSQGGGVANHWYFGIGAGLDFSSGSPVGVLGPINTNEGVATISDVSGNLLFSTDGIYVYNANNLQMPNGFGLWGDPSSTQSGVIVPNPANSNQYYIFTSAAQAGTPLGLGFPPSIYSGIAYSLVDMTLNGGLGDVTTKNVALVNPAAEKITAVKHCNGTDYWVICHAWNSTAFYAYLVTSTGVNAPVITNIGSNYTNLSGSGANEESIGYLKASTDGRRLAAAIDYIPNNNVELFNFDNSTGILSNLVNIQTNGNAYGLSFSPDNTKLYVSFEGASLLLQYDLAAPNIAASAYNVNNSNSNAGAIQLATDGKLYVSDVSATSLSVIQNPNLLGAACAYIPQAIPLSFGASAVFGLPNFIDDLFVPDINLGQDTTFACGAAINLSLNAGTGWTSYSWSTGAVTPTITITQAGLYWVEITKACGGIVRDSILVAGGNTIVDTAAICMGSSYTLPDGTTVSAAGIYTSTLTSPTGCDTVIITHLNIANNIPINLNIAICQGQSHTLPNGTTVSATGIYTTTMPGINTCDTIYTTNLVVNPTYNNTINAAICQGQSYSLPNGTTVSISGTYTQHFSSHSTCDSAITTILTVNPNTSSVQNVSICQGQTHSLPDGTIVAIQGDYSTHLSSSKGCDSLITTHLTLLPISTSTTNISLCQGESYTLPNGTIVNQTSTSTLTLTAANGCDSMASYQIVVHPTYQFTQNAAVCANQTYTLPNGTHATQAGIYPVLLHTKWGCDSLITTILSVNPLPSPQFLVDNVCNGFAMSFDNNSTSDILNPIVSYQWNLGDGSPLLSDTMPLYTYPQAGDYTVSLTATTDKGCSNTFSHIVSVYPTPENPIIQSDTTCLGKDATLFALTNPMNKVYWFEDLASTNNFFIGNIYTVPIALVNDVFYVQSVSPHACKSLKQPIYLTVMGEIIADILPANPVIELPNASLSLSVASPETILSYAWSLGDKDSSYLAFPLHQYHYPGTYDISVQITDKWNCKHNRHTQVEVKEVNSLFIPSAFSPNGDGSNDELTIGTWEVAFFEMTIYNRWGEAVFATQDPHFQWNGKDSKTQIDVPEGVYTYRIRATFASGKKQDLGGTITILR